MTPTATPTIPSDTFNKAISAENRAAPEELWQRLREEPVAFQDGDVWVVSGYPELHALLADPRMSSDYQRVATSREGEENTPFIFTDPPYHDTVRRQAMRHFGPPGCPHKVLSFEGSAERIVRASLDGLRGRTRMDVVADFTYDLPVRLICELLGIPAQDEPLFHDWIDPLVTVFTNPYATPEQQRASEEARIAMGGYLAGIIAQRQAEPRDDMISAVLHDRSEDGTLNAVQTLRNVALMFVAGHVTTVNATTSTILLLLRNPEVLAKVRNDPELVPATFEEGLRIAGPVHFVPRVALEDVPVGGTIIPRDADVRLMLAAGNRDPRRFADPDRFDPTRRDNQHLSFNGGPHLCFGAPLARMEARIMLTEWLRRVQNPRLVTDPPPYGDSPVIVGPKELLVDFDAILD